MWEGGWLATKWQEKASSLLKPAKWHPLGPFSPPHITQSSWIHGQTHQPVVWWITAGCLLVKGICSHLKATRALVDVWQASETSHSKSSQGNFQHQYLPELLFNVYGYHLMVKSMIWCCVHGKWLFSNLVTYTNTHTDTHTHTGTHRHTHTHTSWTTLLVHNRDRPEIHGNPLIERTQTMPKSSLMLLYHETPFVASFYAV